MDVVFLLLGFHMVCELYHGYSKHLLTKLHLSVSTCHRCSFYQLRVIFSTSKHLPTNFTKSLFLMADTTPLYNISHFLYPLLCWGRYWGIHSSIEGVVQLLLIINKAAMNIVGHVTLLYIRASLEYMVGISGCWGRTISKILRNYQIDFQSDFSRFHSQYQWGNVSLFPHLSFWS